VNAPNRFSYPAIGTPFEGGFFAGVFQLDDGTRCGLIVAPKAEGEHPDHGWIDDYKAVPGAQSSNDGLANTIAMAEAGSGLAQWARDIRIGGFKDWYLPSQEELEILYRNLKPTTRENYCYARSGINLAAVPPTRPYRPADPVQTSAEAFREGGSEAFDDIWYWSSSQHAADSDCAWFQHFASGGQDDGLTYGKLRARAVRRVTF
jgi:hypothetical protein